MTRTKDTTPTIARGDLTTGPVAGHIRAIAVPASVGLFFHTMFNVVDTWIAGRLSTDALAALSLSFPAFFVIIALGSGLSTGATALVANALGRKDRESARELASQTMTFALLLSALLAAAGLAIAPAMFRLLGAQEAYLDTALAYMNVIFAGSGLFIFAFCCNALLNAMGDTKSFRNFLIAGCLANVLLDPWFVFGGLGLPALGIAGIAWATLTVELFGAAYLMRRVVAEGLLRPAGARDFLPRARVLGELARQGIPAAVNTATVGLGIFVITYFLSRFGQAPVAAYGAAVRVEQILLMPALGLTTTVLAITAQNNGAGLHDRSRQALNLALLYGGVLMALGGAVLFPAARPLMGLFTDDAEVLALGVSYLRIMAFLLFAYVILFLHVAALQGAKQPMFAIWIGLFRQLAAPLLVFPLLGHVLGWGVDGIWWGLFIVNWSAAAIALIYARRRLPSPEP